MLTIDRLIISDTPLKCCDVCTHDIGRCIGVRHVMNVGEQLGAVNQMIPIKNSLLCSIVLQIPKDNNTIKQLDYNLYIGEFCRKFKITSIHNSKIKVLHSCHSCKFSTKHTPKHPFD